MSTKKTEDENLRVTPDITGITDTATAVAVGFLVFLLILALLYIVNVVMAIVGICVCIPLGESFRGLLIANCCGLVFAPVGTISGSIAKRRSNLLKNVSVVTK